MIDYRLSVLVLEGIDDKAIKLNLNEIIYIYKWSVIVYFIFVIMTVIIKVNYTNLKGPNVKE